MKKFWLFLTIATATLGFVSCGDDDDDSTTPNPPPAVTPASLVGTHWKYVETTPADEILMGWYGWEYGTLDSIKAAGYTATDETLTWALSFTNATDAVMKVTETGIIYQDGVVVEDFSEWEGGTADCTYTYTKPNGTLIFFMTADDLADIPGAFTINGNKLTLSYGYGYSVEFTRVSSAKNFVEPAPATTNRFHNILKAKRNTNK
ncbi:MAG: hypothetical protein LBO06_03530 [Bacteroidales bacterium]|jgi:hypothetical protein|nr:hypothetical protein [Bacteroidales bacterium]